MLMIKSTPKSQTNQLTLIEEEILFLKEVPDPVRVLEGQGTKLNEKLMELMQLAPALMGYRLKN